MHSDREFVIVRYRARLLLVPGPPGFPGLFELPLRSCFAPATARPSQVRLLLHRLRPCSKLVYVSRRNVTFRPKQPRHLQSHLSSEHGWLPAPTLLFCLKREAFRQNNGVFPMLHTVMRYYLHPFFETRSVSKMVEMRCYRKSAPS
jgi:hypothetical protein